MASHCYPHSRRDKYVNELQLYMPVVKLGECGDRHCHGTRMECYRHLAAGNLFYLAFENSLCEDYITEKFWLALRVGMVPVVRGPLPEAYRRVAPPNSFIHVQEFSTPSALATFLRRLAADSPAYEDYLAWRATHRVQKVRQACGLCAELWKAAGEPQQLKLSDMWSEKKCHRARDVPADDLGDWLRILKHGVMKQLKTVFNRT